MSDLARDILMLTELVNEVQTAITTTAWDYLEDDEREQMLVAWATLEEANRVLGSARKDFADNLGGVFPDKRVISPTLGKQIERNSRKDTSTKCTDDDGLWRLTLDTRIVDELTGEIMPQAEIIRRVYGSESKETGKVRLTGSSPGKAEAVFGPEFDPDEYFAKGKHIGWTLRIV